MNMSIFCPLISGTWAGTLLLDMVTQYDIAGCAAEPSGFQLRTNAEPIFEIVIALSYTSHLRDANDTICQY